MAAIPTSASSYRFGRFELDCVNQRLLLDRRPFALPWRCFDALKLLVEAQGQVVDRQAFFQQLWPNIQVEETSLTKVMSQLRRLLAEGDPSTEYLETVTRLGYRLTVPVAVGPPSALPDAEVPRALPQGPWRRRGVLAAAACLVCLAAWGAVQWWSDYQVRQQAETLYSEGRRLRRQGDPASLAAAVQAYRSATLLRPRQAAYYSALAETLSQVTLPEQPDWAPMREAAAKAVELDPRCADCQAMLGYALFSRFWDWKKGGDHLRESLRLDPSHAGRHGYMAMYLSSQGRLSEALRHADESVRLQPFFANGYYIRSIVLHLLERYDDSIKAADRALALNPLGRGAQEQRAAAFVRIGREQEALTDWARYLSMDHAKLDSAYRNGGMRKAIGLLLDQTAEPAVRRGHSYRRARWRMHLGDGDGALTELETALEFRHFNLMYLAADPSFAPLRSEPRFHEILRKMGLPDVR